MLIVGVGLAALVIYSTRPSEVVIPPDATRLQAASASTPASQPTSASSSIDQVDPCQETRGRDSPNYFGPGMSAGAYVTGVLSCTESAVNQFAKQGMLLRPADEDVRRYCQCFMEKAFDYKTGRVDAALLVDKCSFREVDVGGLKTRVHDFRSPIGDRKLKLERACMGLNRNDASYCSCYVDGVMSNAKDVDTFCRKVADFWREHHCSMPKPDKRKAASQPKPVASAR